MSRNEVDPDMRTLVNLLASTSLLSAAATAGAKDIAHGAELYIAQKQHGARWAQEDEVLDRKLAEFHGCLVQ